MTKATLEVKVRCLTWLPAAPPPRRYLVLPSSGSGSGSWSVLVFEGTGGGREQPVKMQRIKKMDEETEAQRRMLGETAADWLLLMAAF